MFQEAIYLSIIPPPSRLLPARRRHYVIFTVPDLEIKRDDKVVDAVFERVFTPEISLCGAIAAPRIFLRTMNMPQFSHYAGIPSSGHTKATLISPRRHADKAD
jgi:hypothetical protein